MIAFCKPVLADKPQMDAVCRAGYYRANDYCFGNLFVWRNRFQPALAFQNDSLLVKFTLGGKPAYLYPAGGNVAAAVRLLAADARERGSQLRLAAVSREMADELGTLFPGVFEWTSARGDTDYIYSTSDLRGLAGRKFHSKRTHITHFMELGEWAYEDVTAANLEECRAMNEEWFRQNPEDEDPNLKFEHAAIEETFTNYGRLGFTGGLLRLAGRVVAFTMGEPLCRDTFVVHFEKAFGSIDGAYPTINREFVRHRCGEFRYVNREEDLGDEGLRRAKLSYQPEILLDRGVAVLKEGAEL